MTHADHVVEIIRSHEGGGLLARLRPQGPRIPKPRKGEDLYLIRDVDEGDPRLERISAGTSGPGTLPKDARLARVRVTPQSLDLALTALLRDRERHPWDLLLAGSWQIVDGRRFLREYALKALATGSAFHAEAMRSWLARTLRKPVADAVGKHSLEALREKDALPQRWWQQKLGEWLETYGIEATLTLVTWDSADARRAEAERRQQEDLGRIEVEQRRQREAELREAETALRYQQEKARLEADHQTTESEKEHRIRLLEEKHRKEVLATHMEQEQARWSHERARLEHELAMAKLRDEIAAIQTAEEREAAATRRHQEILGRLEATQISLQQLQATGQPLLSRLHHADPMTAHQAAERLTSPEFNVAPEVLDSLGYAVSPQVFISRLQQRQATSRHQVEIRMKDLRSRDIGTAQPIRVDALPIGASLQFELTSTLAGYVTLINIGTSGRVWLQVPNPFVAPHLARIDADTLYTVPGPLLLPPHAIPGYFEQGPAGWEHLALTITDVPIVDPGYLALATPEAPFIDLTSEAASDLAASLEDPDVADYAIGLLSFLVE